MIASWVGAEGGASMQVFKRVNGKWKIFENANQVHSKLTACKIKSIIPSNKAYAVLCSNGTAVTWGSCMPCALFMSGLWVLSVIAMQCLGIAVHRKKCRVACRIGLIGG